MTEGEHVLEDYVSLRLSLRTHPVALLRPSISGQFGPSQRFARTPSGRRVAVCGLVLARQKPGTASGVVFITLEDETGSANIVVWPKVYEDHKRTVINARFLRIEGKLERQGIVAHLIADKITDLSPMLSELPKHDVDGPLPPEGSQHLDRALAFPLAHGDEVTKPVPLERRPARLSEKPPCKKSWPVPAIPESRPRYCFLVGIFIRAKSTTEL